MTQWAKGLATKPGTLSLMPRSPRRKRKEVTFPSYLLTATQCTVIHSPSPINHPSVKEHENKWNSKSEVMTLRNWSGSLDAYLNMQLIPRNLGQSKSAITCEQDQGSKAGRGRENEHEGQAFSENS